MSRDRDRHARILTRIWDDDDWKARTPRAQWCYMMLLSQASLNRAGVLGMTMRRWTKHAKGVTLEHLTQALEELAQFEFVVVDHDTEELLVRSYMRNDGVAKQPNVLKAALRQAREVHSPVIRAALAVELRRLEHPDAALVADSLVKANGNPSANPSRRVPSTPSEGFREPRGEGEGVSSSPSVALNSSSSSSSEIAPRPRPDVEELCSRLSTKLRDNGVKRHAVTEAWREAARLLLDRDERPLEQALWLVDFSAGHHFWHKNILGMPKFRQQYDRLLLEARPVQIAPPPASSGATGSRRVNKAIGFLSPNDPLRQQLEARRAVTAPTLPMIEGGKSA